MENRAKINKYRVPHECNVDIQKKIYNINNQPNTDGKE